MIPPSLPSVRVVVFAWALVEGTWWRALATTPADSELPAGLELGEALHHDGCWSLRWVPIEAVDALELSASVPQ